MRHHSPLITAIHHHQTIQLQRCSLGRHIAVKLQALRSQLEHRAEYRKPPTGLGRQQSKGSHDRFRRGVVGLIEKRESPLNQTAIAPARHRHLDGVERIAGHTKLVCHSQGQQKVSSVMAPLQWQQQAMGTKLKVASIDRTDAISRHRGVVR